MEFTQKTLEPSCPLHTTLTLTLPSVLIKAPTLQVCRDDSVSKSNQQMLASEAPSLMTT